MIFLRSEEPRLPLDVLVEVLRWTDFDTAKALSVSWKSLRDYGAIRMLDHGVLISTPEAWASFILFMQGGHLRRWSHLKIFNMTLPLAETNSADSQILDVFSRMIELRQLVLTDPEPVLGREPGLVDAITSHKEIKTLKVKNAGEMTVLLLQTMQSRLKAIDISGIEHLPAKRLCFSTALALHRETLYWVKVGRNVSILDETATKLITYDAVRYLSVADCAVDNGDRYMRTFPHISVLDAGHGREMDKKTEDASDDNKFINDNFAEAHPEHPWNNLQLVRGGLVDVWSMGNALSTVALEISGAIRQQRDFDLFLEAIDDCAPLTLRFCAPVTLRVDSLCDSDSEPLTDCVDNLTVRLLLERSEGDATGYLNDILEFLPTLSETFTEVVRAYLDIAWNEDDVQTQALAQDINIEDVIAKMVALMPYLRFALVKCANQSRFWSLGEEELQPLLEDKENVLLFSAMYPYGEYASQVAGWEFG